MSKAITKVAAAEPAAIDAVIAAGDLSKLTPEQRVSYYRNVCESVGLNPMTRPFEYITLQGKLTLYARKDATDQLRKLHGVSIQVVSRETINGVYVVTARGTDKSGRYDESIGAVTLAGKGGDDACNALMKAETKAKRRVTLSLCGLGWLDESEIETIPVARLEHIDHETGEVLDSHGEPPQPTVVREVVATREGPTSEEVRIRAVAALQVPGADIGKLQSQFVKYRKVLNEQDTIAINTAIGEAWHAAEKRTAMSEVLDGGG